MSKSLLRDVWYSVLRLENTVTDELATALVFDVYEDHGSLYMLLLMNHHFVFTGNQLVRALFVDDSNQCLLAEFFTKKDVTKYWSGDMNKGEDAIIYSLKLDGNEWIMVEPGRVERIQPKEQGPPKKKRAAAPVSIARAAIMCKTPRYTYECNRSMDV